MTTVRSRFTGMSVGTDTVWGQKVSLLRNGFRPRGLRYFVSPAVMYRHGLAHKQACTYGIQHLRPLQATQVQLVKRTGPCARALLTTRRGNDATKGNIKHQTSSLYMTNSPLRKRSGINGLPLQVPSTALKVALTFVQLHV